MEDEGIITEVHDVGYVVYQVDEPEESGGSGWYAAEDEVADL